MTRPPWWATPESLAARHDHLATEPEIDRWMRSGIAPPSRRAYALTAVPPVKTEPIEPIEPIPEPAKVSLAADILRAVVALITRRAS